MSVWVVFWAASPSDHGIEWIFASEDLARLYAATKGVLEESMDLYRSPAGDYEVYEEAVLDALP